ncbi:hypothetical protein TanjilG_28276 [Lupinus angustifolius]|uniref:Uncharacterized protein n=1 Tax=Lupinus angustifolius TaxID=3871 RepID=A0A1J7FMA9_LUPAN|nr:hypothetical protein TanjilG_28276 [Lupinus angustifolius]
MDESLPYFGDHRKNSSPNFEPPHLTITTASSPHERTHHHRRYWTTVNHHKPPPSEPSVIIVAPSMPSSGPSAPRKKTNSTSWATA